ncbi:50S ribosomal protein L14 [Candidatus Woesearchaeota archaeon]|nr:50S ribosomal protein L14P [uncultured archaeon]MBS3153187.1 50S ribosomal protein L14 [Candidatus Woesearchaeota archaeon]
MKAFTARITRALNLEAKVPVCDNSGAKLIKIFSVKGLKTTKGKFPAAGIGDMVNASIVKGKPGLKGQVVPAIIVRQRKEYRRLNGERIKFEDNAAVILKDEKGNPKGTMIKGAIAKEVAERWPGIAKIASIIV